VPQILRIFRGRTIPGELDTYVEHARQGTMADALADHGPEALFLARVPPDQFVTVSAWSTWEDIAASTGGNLRQPIGTRYSELLAGGAAAFFEIVPNTPSGRVEAVAPSDVSPASSADPSDQAPALIAVPELPAATPGSG
jgi:hypothetical protein